MLTLGLKNVVVARKLASTSQIGSVLKSISAGFHTSRSDQSLGEAIQNLRFQLYHDPNHHLKYDKWAKIFSVEGNIKAGKSAFAKEFAEKLELDFFPCAKHTYMIERNAAVFPKEEIEYLLQPDSPQSKMWNVSPEKVFSEPENWQNLGRHQIAMTMSRSFQHMDALRLLLGTGQGSVVESSFYPSHAYPLAFKKMKWVKKDLYDYFIEMQKELQKIFLPPQVMLYLDVPPEQCLENIKKNGAPAERHITLDFLKALDEAYHTKVIPDMLSKGVKVIEMDWSSPRAVEDVIEELDEMPTLLHDTTEWTLENMEYKMILRKLTDDMVFLGIPFTRIEEMWDPNWGEWLQEKYNESKPWKYRKGYNANLGDKYIWLKD